MTLSDWQKLLECPRNLELLQDLPIDELAAVTHLRRHLDPGVAAAAYEVHLVRKRIAKRFPSWGPSWVGDRESSEQATPEYVAIYKGQRIAELADQSPVWDLCCGAGADAVGMSLAGVQVRAMDRDPLRCLFSSVNGQRVAPPGFAVTQGDVQEFEVQDAFVHLDPGRRSGGRRTRDWEAFEPPWSVFKLLMERARGGVVKLPPGLDLEWWNDLSDELPGSHHLQLVSVTGELNQALWWFGAFAPMPGMSAVRVSEGGKSLMVHSGMPIRASDEEGGAFGEPRFLMTCDPALERLGLVSRLKEAAGTWELMSGLGWRVSIAPPSQTPWTQVFPIRQAMAYSERKVKRALQKLGAGQVEVRIRGTRKLPGNLPTRLSGGGPNPFVVFLFRADESLNCVICTRPQR